MGSCSSVHRSQETTTNMKLGLSLGSKTDSLVIPASPIKDNNDNNKPQNANFCVVVHGAAAAALKPHRSPSRSTTTFTDYSNNGSKEEAFFDSKAWLDSDTEDDFYSVNGEFTPSRGTTPVHHAFVTPVINNTPPENIIPGSTPEPSPTEKRKKLLELFRESIREDKGDDGVVQNTSGDEKKESKPIVQDLLPKSARSTPYISGVNSACSSERTMDEDHTFVEEKPVKSVQCCLPSFASCRSFSERRKASPAITASGKA